MIDCKMKRTFIALKIKPDPSFSRFIHDLQRKIEGNLRWSDPDNLHLTLRFIGNTEEIQSNKIVEKMSDIFRGYSSFDMEIRGLGIFGSARFPRILWAGVEMPRDSFRLVENIEDMICGEGFDAETKNFSPHLTLSRIKYLRDPSLIMSLVKEFKETFFLRQKISEIIFYESILQSSGSIYKPLYIFRLHN